LKKVFPVVIDHDTYKKNSTRFISMYLIFKENIQMDYK